MFFIFVYPSSVFSIFLEPRGLSGIELTMSFPGSLSTRCPQTGFWALGSLGRSLVVSGCGRLGSADRCNVSENPSGRKSTHSLRSYKAPQPNIEYIYTYIYIFIDISMSSVKSWRFFQPLVWQSPSGWAGGAFMARTCRSLWPAFDAGGGRLLGDSAICLGY